MTGREQLSMGRKAETIYTAMKKNLTDCRKWHKADEARQRVSSFEEHLNKSAASKACYVYINGIMMPVLSA